MEQNSFGYLKIFQNQNRNLLFLSKVLLFVFLGFMLLVSLILFQGWQSGALAIEWLFGLGLFDGILLVASLQAFFALQRFQRKSKAVIRKMQRHLSGDSQRIAQLRNQNQKTKTSIERLQDRLADLLPEELPEEVNYEGWDSKTCPYCLFQIEMLSDECPHCSSPFDQITAN